MKKLCKLLGVIAIGAVITIALAGCAMPTGGRGNSDDDDGNNGKAYELEDATSWNQAVWEAWFEGNPVSNTAKAQAVAQFAASNATWIASHSWWSSLYNAWATQERSYTVTFVVDGSVIDTQTVAEEQSATPPANPTKPGHAFDGWEGDYTHITDDTTITAKWKENLPGQQYYTVTFLADDKVLLAQAVLEGGDATPPSNPTKPGHAFNGWEEDYTHITSDTTITAKWIVSPPEPDGTLEDATDWDQAAWEAWFEGHPASNAANAQAAAQFATSNAIWIASHSWWSLLYSAWAAGDPGPGPGPGGALEGATDWDQATWETWFGGHPASNAANAQAAAQFATSNATWIASHSWWLSLYSAWAPGTPGPGGALDGATSWTQSQWETWFGGHPVSDTANAQVVAQFLASNPTWSATHAWWSSLYSAWVTPEKSYTVTFVVDGSVIDTQTVAKGQSATPPATPAKSGYTFDGWKGDYTNITGDTTITAQWTVITGKRSITLTIPDRGAGAFSQSDFIIYKSHYPQTQTITPDGEWANVQWHVGRALETPAQDHSITINSADYPRGTYELTAVVKKTDGSSWSKSISFTVEN
jgi:uncharacterized repeat protein (TIGR02543 family)